MTASGPDARRDDGREARGPTPQAAPEEIDDKEPFGSLGRRIADLLQQAHDVSDKMVRDAEAESRTLREKAQRSAAEIETKAQALLEEAEREAKQLQSQVRADVMRQREDAKREVRDAEARAAAILNEARREAEQIYNEAKEDSEKMWERAERLATRVTEALERNLGSTPSGEPGERRKTGEAADFEVVSMSEEAGGRRRRP